MPSAKNKVQPQNISHEHELDSKGVYQLANGAWAYRFCKSVNGKNVYKRASTDRKGNPLLTQRDAMLAREEAMLEAQGVYTPVISTLGIVYRPSATIEEVYEDYCANGRGDRSHNTIKRQDTLWRTYLKADFGKKRFNGISLGEIQDYLANKYYVEGYSYRHVCFCGFAQKTLFINSSEILNCDFLLVSDYLSLRPIKFLSFFLNLRPNIFKALNKEST